MVHGLPPGAVCWTYWLPRISILLLEFRLHRVIFYLLVALTISFIVGFSSRAVLTLRYCMFSNASGSMSPGTFTPSCHHTLAICEGFITHHMISDVHVVSSVDHTLPLIHCKCPSCSAALCSSSVFISHYSDFRARVYLCSIMQASLYASTADLVLLICNTIWWTWSLLAIKSCSIWSFGSNLS